jgi:peptide/nickel transport system permease protein
VSVPLGIWVAARQERALDRVIRLGTSFFISLPEVVIAVALLALVVRWRIVPVGGMHAIDSEGMSSWARWRDLASRMVLPVSILVLVESAIIVRHVRASVVEVLSMPFVNAARGLGIGRVRLLFRHVQPVAASPLISLFGFSLAGLISGSLLVEVVCGWPGLGPMILEATFSRDLYIVIAGIMLSALFMISGTMVADLMLLICDPRIRTGAPDAL